jgi:hypothetical protein
VLYSSVELDERPRFCRFLNYISVITTDSICSFFSIDMENHQRVQNETLAIGILFEVSNTGNAHDFDRRDQTGVPVIKRDVIITANVVTQVASFGLLSAHKYVKTVLLIHGFSQFPTLIFHH